MSNIDRYITDKAAFDEDRGIWVLAETKKHRYRDSLLSEPYQRRVLRDATDLSTDSDELEAAAVDLITEYNFSRKRSLILKGFEHNPDASVLEVGCGCGAITRFLGETFNDVFSVEGSPSRAHIARLRTSGMENVTILTAPFHELGYARKFDLIVCVGVLEYSSMFIKGDDPLPDALRFLQGLLTENGSLVIAIENQFGLKYLAGCSEDHTGIRYDGIEGYPVHGKSHPMTYGRKELTENLDEAGFESHEFYYPFPDYKFPECIVSDKALARDGGFNAGELVGQFRDVDYHRNYTSQMNMKLAWWELSRNSMVRDLSNSFLIIANNSATGRNISAPWEICLFNVRRKKKYSSITRFSDRDGRLAGIKRFPFKEDGDDDERLTLLQEESLWKTGQSLEMRLEKAFKSSGFGLDDFVSMLRPWVEFLAGGTPATDDMNVPGTQIDAMPWNLIPGDEGYVFIDSELCWNEELSLKFCVTRGVYYLLSRNAGKANSLVNFRLRSISSVLRAVCSSIFPSYGSADIREFLDMEARFGSCMSGKSTAFERRFLALNMKKRIMPRMHLYRKYTDGFHRYMRHFKSALNILALNGLKRTFIGKG